ncbi:MAG: BTAD domain-containing putative transcriptional regulator [Gemmatimonadota bacterium]
MIEPIRPAAFRILGTLEVRAGDGDEWTGVGAPKQRALLAALLLRPGQTVATERLIDEVWGDGVKVPARAANLVSVYMHHLRKLIGDTDGTVLVTRSPGYRAELPPGALDAQRFEELTAAGRRELAAGNPAQAAPLLADALSLWRGRALADVPASALISAEAARLEDARIEAQALRIEADLRCGRGGEVVGELRRLLADNPLREELWALLMQALHGAGLSAAALAEYARAREIIADELGVDPGPRLQQIYAAILSADADAGAGPPAAGADQAAAGTDQAAADDQPAAPAPAQLPADIADFTGRAGQVDQLCALLAGEGREDNPEAVPVVVVVGSGGLGKTTLAVHAAHLLAARFPDGQLHVNLLGATQPVSPAEVLARCLRDLGVDPAHIPAGEEERAGTFRTRLAGRRVLVVLDDARDAAQVRPLLPGSASCAVLITSRSRLPELVGTRILDLEVLPAEEARTLFARVAGEQRAAAEPADTDRVLAACAGLPLAIRIAGARLAARGGWNVHYLAGRLADERRRLDELRAGNLAVRASFEVSFSSLSSAARPGGVDPAHAFRLLGVWTGPSVPLGAAAALLGVDEADAADALEVLVDAHLLDEPEPDQYRFHDLLRVYAADRARAQETDEDRHAAITRVLTWYLHTVEAAARVISAQRAQVPLDPPPPDVAPLTFVSMDDALDWCEAQRPGLIAATKLAADAGLHQIAWQLPAAAMSFFYRHSHWTDWVSAHEVGLASARILGDRLAKAWMLNNLGMAYGSKRLGESVACFEQALALYRELGDPRGETRAANNVANAYFQLGRFEEALDAAQRSLGIQRRLGNRYGEGIALNLLGCASRELLRYDAAVDHLQQALAVFRELGDPMVEADSLSDLGEVYLHMGESGNALACLRESLGIWRSSGNRHGEATALYRLGMAIHQSGDLAAARGTFSEALQLFEKLGDHDQADQVRLSLGKIATRAS